MQTFWLRPRREALQPPRGPIGGRVLVLAEGDNASLAYFVRPRLAASSATEVLVDSRLPPSGDLSGFSAAVIVRYLPRHWQDALVAMRNAGKPVAYFMDDDLMDAEAHRGLPKPYRRKIDRLARGRRDWIESIATEFWVSTPFLETKYAAWSPERLVPGIDAATRTPTGQKPVTVCYHGTAAHPDEQQWLLGVVRDLQARRTDTHFCIVGDLPIQKIFRTIPRVTVLHPMSWPNYLAMTRAMPMAVALAPLMPNPFNAARSPTKFFDYTRLGAAGIYADVEPYRGFVRDGIDGILVPMEAPLWIDAIGSLVADPARRESLVRAAVDRLDRDR